MDKQGLSQLVVDLETERERERWTLKDLNHLIDYLLISVTNILHLSTAGVVEKSWGGIITENKQKKTILP